MPRRERGKALAVVEQVGRENWGALEELIREVFQRVGPRAMEWRLAWGVEPLVGLVVMHTAIVTAREMRLGELAEQLKTAEADRRTLERVEGVLAKLRDLADGTGSNRANFPHDMAYAANLLTGALGGGDG